MTSLHTRGLLARAAAAAAVLLATLALAACQGRLTDLAPPAPDDEVEGPGDAPGGSPADPGSRDDPSDPRDDPADPGDDPTGSVLPSCFDEGFDPGSGHGAGGDVGGPCEVTEECREPLMCIDGECVAPGEEGRWCDGIDIVCPPDGTECIGGFCVFPPGGCAQNIDCPSGYICEDGVCVPESGDCYADGDCPPESICVYGECVSADECIITEDLRGTFAAESTMHLGEATDGVVGAILEATEWIRDLLQGRGGIPGIGFLVDDLIRSWIEENLYPYQIEAIIALGDLSDLLDDMRIDHTMQLDAPCRELYRGSISFDRISVEYRGEVISDRPEDIPHVGAVPPAEFGAVLHCGSIVIDEFRVEQLIGGLIRWLTDAVVQQASEGHYRHLEDALVDVIDCSDIGSEIGGWMGAAVATACDVALDDAIDEVSEAIDEAAFDLGRMRVAGEAEVPDSDHLTNGLWSGSLATGDFTGEFSATRTR